MTELDLCTECGGEVEYCDTWERNLTFGHGRYGQCLVCGNWVNKAHRCESHSSVPGGFSGILDFDNTDGWPSR